MSVGRWTEVDDLNNLLATGDAPDVCVTYSYPTIQTFAGMDGIIDLNPLLTEYKDLLPDLWALLGDYNIYYDQDPETGSVWAIEAVLAESARINTFIRKDWLTSWVWRFRRPKPNSMTASWLSATTLSCCWAPTLRRWFPSPSAPTSAGALTC